MADVSLSLLVIRSSDLDKSLEFYSALGLEFTRERHGDGPEHYACDLDGTVFEIYPETSGPTSAARLGFRVLSVERAFADLVRVGAAVVRPPHDSPWGQRAVVVDPDGHRLELAGSAGQDVHLQPPRLDAPPSSLLDSRHESDASQEPR